MIMMIIILILILIIAVAVFQGDFKKRSWKGREHVKLIATLAPMATNWMMMVT